MGKPDVEPKVKGIAFRTIEACFSDLRGLEARDRARELMGPELADLYKNGLMLASSWYPISWYRDAFRAFRSVTGEGTELAREIGYAAVRRDMNSVHKMLFAKIVSPQILISVSARLFNTYYDTGNFNVIESRSGYLSVAFRDCVGWDENMWTEMAGSCLCFLEVAGAKRVRMRTVSGGRDGDTETRFEAHWF